jgi:hypothetical protein
MDFRDCRGVSEVELIETFIKPNAMRVEHGSHRTIGEDQFGGESFQYIHSVSSMAVE